MGDLNLLILLSNLQLFSVRDSFWVAFMPDILLHTFVLVTVVSILWELRTSVHFIGDKYYPDDSLSLG